MLGIFKKRNSDLFKVNRTNDGYYLVLFKNSNLLYTTTNEKAQQLIEEIIDMYDWKKVQDIKELASKDKDSYKRIAVILNRYAVPRVFNGNYQESRDGDQVVYRISQGSNKLVSGEDNGYGVAIREGEERSNYYVDSILSGDSFGPFSTKAKAKKFIKETSKIVSYSNGNATNLLSKTDMYEVFERMVDSIENDRQVTQPTEKEKYSFLYETFNDEKNDEFYINRKDSFVKSFLELNKLVGLKDIKEKMNHLIQLNIANQKLNSFHTDNIVLHSLFVGDAGTGKTVVARLFSDLLWSIGAIEEKKYIELSKEDLSSKYVGETEEVVKSKVNEALGGVLFVDEAYMLAENSGNNNLGKLALEIIMRAMENNRDNLVVIFAGYEKEMKKLLDLNQGLRSRFVNTFKFENYSLDELVEITHRMIDDKGFYSRDIEADIKSIISQRMKNSTLSGNARTIRKVVDKIVQQHKIAVSQKNIHKRNISSESIQKLMSGQKSEGTSEQKEQAILKLKSLIGLQSLKQEIETWSNYVFIERMRFKQGISSDSPTLHMTFEGNPGTGKTTVARIIGDILKVNGLLSVGSFKEVSRSELVGEYVGHTAIKVKELVEECKGGILFIDEAYSLVQGKDDTFGKEAVDTLIAEMENNRDDLVVILAGYTKEIEKLLKSNPGFSSRIANRFEFPDYDIDELKQLMDLRMNQSNFILIEDAKERLYKYIEKEKQLGNVDGNGRWIRNVVDKIKMNQANRLVKVAPSKLNEELKIIRLDDVINL